MAGRVSRGDVFVYSFRPPDKQRPVVVLTRDGAIPFLDTVMVAPITSTIRGLPSEVEVGVSEGLDRPSAVNLDHIQTVAKARLGRRLGALDAAGMQALCAALAVAVQCDE